ncbi:MAG: hypothetical protein BWY88_00144 [Synergistetes bacterium ADurb.Bin520]|nr:MAG: hypothetical protein BWY88_00144 [Synergistetes bacterium ADurb.Bin520]
MTVPPPQGFFPAPLEEKTFSARSWGLGTLLLPIIPPWPLSKKSPGASPSGMQGVFRRFFGQKTCDERLTFFALCRGEKPFLSFRRPQPRPRPLDTLRAEDVPSVSTWPTPPGLERFHPHKGEPHASLLVRKPLPWHWQFLRALTTTRAPHGVFSPSASPEGAALTGPPPGFLSWEPSRRRESEEFTFFPGLFAS